MTDVLRAGAGLTVEQARALFPITATGEVWLQHAGGSPVSSRVHRALREAVDAVAAGMEWTQDYYRDREDVRRLAGSLLSTGPENVTIVRSTGHGLSLLAAGLDWQAGDNVVGARWEYPTNLLPWMALERHGVDLRLVEPRDGRVTADAVADLVDDRTRAVVLSWVQFWNGYRIDAAAIGELCRKRRIVFALDGIQGLGALPLDVEDAGVDLLAAGAIKWLMGPVGVGIAYVSPSLRERLAPPLVGAGSVRDAGSRNFDPVLEWHPAARRFEESAHSWFDLAGLRASLGLLTEVGTDVVQEQVLRLSTHLGEGLARLGHDVVDPWPRTAAESSGIVAFRAPGGDPALVQERLSAAGVTVGVHADMVRFSPHFYNTVDEMDHVLGALGPV